MTEPPELTKDQRIWIKILQDNPTWLDENEELNSVYLKLSNALKYDSQLMRKYQGQCKPFILKVQEDPAGFKIQKSPAELAKKEADKPTEVAKVPKFRFEIYSYKNELKLPPILELESGLKKFFAHSKKYIEAGRLSFRKFLSEGVLAVEDGKKNEGNDSREVKLEPVSYPILPSYIEVSFLDDEKLVEDEKTLDELIKKIEPSAIEIRVGDSTNRKKMKPTNSQMEKADARSWYRFEKMLGKYNENPKPHYTVQSILEAYEDIKKNSTGLEDYAEKIKQELIGTLTTASYDLPKGILFYGPPRTGKTFTSKRLIASLDLFRIHDDLAAGDFNKPLQGQSEEMINKIANRCDVLPWELCTLFIDEIDGLFPNRMTASASGSKIDMISIFLAQMDGNKKKSNLFVVGTSNRLKQMDAAFLQRMDVKLFLGLPNSNSRASWVKSIAEKYQRTPNNTPKYVNRVKDIFKLKETSQNLLRYTMNFTADAMKKSFSQIVQKIINEEDKYKKKDDDELKREIKKLALKDIDRICENDKIFISSYTPASIMVVYENLILMNAFDKNVLKLDVLAREKNPDGKLAKSKRMLIDFNEKPEEQFQVETQGSPEKVAPKMVELLSKIDKYVKSNKGQKVEEWQEVIEGVMKEDKEYFNNLNQNEHGVYESLTAKSLRVLAVKEFFKNYYLEKTATKKNQERKVLQTFGLSTERSLTTLSKGEVFSILCEMAQQANLNYVCVIDSNYFRNLGLTTDDKMAQEIKGVTDEALQYESSMVIFDLDSIADITKNFADLKSDMVGSVEDYQDSKDAPTFSYEINYPMAFRASLEMFNTVTKKEKNNWLVAVSASNKLTLDLKEKTDWPATKSIQELEQKIDMQSQTNICGTCFETYKEKDNSETECAKHFSAFLYDEDDYQKNKLKCELETSLGQVALEAGLKEGIVEPKDAWEVTKIYSKPEIISMLLGKNSTKSRHNLGRFKWMCCQKGFFEKGEIKCRHTSVSGDLEGIFNPINKNYLLHEGNLDLIIK